MFSVLLVVYISHSAGDVAALSHCDCSASASLLDSLSRRSCIFGCSRMRRHHWPRVLEEVWTATQLRVACCGGLQSQCFASFIFAYHLSVGDFLVPGLKWSVCLATFHEYVICCVVSIFGGCPSLGHSLWQSRLGLQCGHTALSLLTTTWSLSRSSGLLGSSLAWSVRRL